MRIRESYGISSRINELIVNLEELENAVSKGEKSVDLCEAKFITPISILPLAIYGCSNNISVTCSEKKNDIQDYLNTIGFPNGLTELPKRVERYLPITRLPPVENNTILGEYEDKILSQASKYNNKDSFKNSLKHLTSELANNVNEHSNAEQYWLLAQYYRANNMCEIVLADCGIGYKKSYIGTKYEVDSDKQAIINALEGKSSKKHLEQERGFGLPTIANMFVNGYNGKLVIISGESGIYYKQNERKEIKLRSYWQGSLVGINFNLKPIDFFKYLNI